MIAAGLAQAWAAESNGEAAVEMAREIESAEPDLASRIEKAIRFVQDECRYLSLNLELGGQIPTSPGLVAKRRFGDCKDLSFLLVHLLRSLGVRAQPILVNTFLRRTIGEFLPVPSLFNHVVVEFEADGKRRWIDPTFKKQGGGAFNRFIPDYGFGLPVDRQAAGLTASPEIPTQSHLFELREHVLLETRDAPSLMEVTLAAEGNQADQLRYQLSQSGLEEMAKQRQQAIVGRFGNANRIGSIKYRDDRAANRFVLNEVFEIKFGLGSHPNPKMCRVALPSGWLGGVLATPEAKERQAPFMLPWPCRIQYTADVDCGAIQKMSLRDPRTSVSSAFFEFEKTHKHGNGYYLMQCSLATKTETVPPEAILEHRERVEKVRGACNRELRLLRGYARPTPRPGFGELPPVRDEEPAKPPAPASAPRIFIPPNYPESSRRRHRNKWRRLPLHVRWLIGLLLAAVVITFLHLLLP